MFDARVRIILKDGIADPQGQTLERALPALGFDGVEDIRVGKIIEMKLEASDTRAARTRVEQMCEQLLANPVIESFEVEIK